MIPARRLVLFYLVLALLAAPFAFQTVVSNDIWKSLYTGRYIATTLSFPAHGAFSFMPVKEQVLAKNGWTWLGNLTFYGLWLAGGIPTLQVFRWGLLLVSLALLHGIVRFRASPLVLLLFAGAVFGLEQKLILRNALFLIPGLCCFFWLWHRTVHRRRTRWAAGFVVLLVVWSNLHGSYLVGVGLLLIMIGGLILDGLRGISPADTRTYLWLGGSWLVGLAGVTYLKPLAPDPQAIGLFQRVWKLGRRGLLGPSLGANAPASAPAGIYGTVKRFLQGTLFSHVGGGTTTYSTDFLFPPEHLDQLYVLTSVLLIGLGLAAFLVSKRRLRWSLFSAFLAASAVGMLYLRTVAIIPLTVTPVLLMKTERGDFEAISLSAAARRWTAVGILIVVGALYYPIAFPSLPESFAPTSYRVFGFGVHPRLSSPVPDHLLARYPRKRFFNSYNLGSWLIWKWWPHKKVFMDSKNSGYRSDFRVDVLTKSPYQLIGKYSMDHAILTLSDPVVYFHLVPDPDWQLIALDQGMIAFRRAEEGRAGRPPDLAGSLRVDRTAWRKLPHGSKVYLHRVIAFVHRHANQPDHMAQHGVPPAVRPDSVRTYPLESGETSP